MIVECILKACKEKIVELEWDAWDHMKIMNEKSKSEKSGSSHMNILQIIQQGFIAIFFWHKLNFNNLNKGKINFFSNVCKEQSFNSQHL